MTNFTESDHPRDTTSGEFATKSQTSPEITIVSPASSAAGFTKDELRAHVSAAAGPMIVSLDDGFELHPLNGYIDHAGDLVLVGDEDEETNGMTAQRFRSLVDNTGDDLSIRYGTTALTYARLDSDSQLHLSSVPIAFDEASTESDWDDLDADEHLLFEDESGLGWVEVHRTSEETDADNDSDSETWAETGVSFDLERIIPAGTADATDFLDEHQNTIDTWLRDSYDDGRYTEGPNGQPANVLFVIDADGTSDGQFPATLDGVRAHAEKKPEIVRLRADLASGAFYDKLNAAIATTGRG